MNPSAVGAGALLTFVAVAAALGAFRRRRAIYLGEPYPLNVYPGLRWSAAVRFVAIVTALILLTVIAVANVEPLVNRLFPLADSAGREEIILAFHEVLAASVVGVSAAAALTDLSVTFVRAVALRRMLMSAFTLGIGVSAIYGGLFVFALSIS